MADSDEARFLSVTLPGEEDERVSCSAPARQRNAWRPCLVRGRPAGDVHLRGVWDAVGGEGGV